MAHMIHGDLQLLFGGCDYYGYLDGVGYGYCFGYCYGYGYGYGISNQNGEGWAEWLT